MKSYDFKVDGQSFTARIIEYTDTKVIVDLNGNNYEVKMTSETSAAPVALAPQRPAPNPRSPAKKAESPPTAGRSGPGAVTAPIPGVVKQIMVSVGDQVKNDTVVTSGYNSTFPPGITIGVVKKVGFKSEQTFFDIDVQLSTGFSQLSYVYIIKNRLKLEQESLERESFEDIDE